MKLELTNPRLLCILESWSHTLLFWCKKWIQSIINVRWEPHRGQVLSLHFWTKQRNLLQYPPRGGFCERQNNPDRDYFMWESNVCLSHSPVAVIWFMRAFTMCLFTRLCLNGMGERSFPCRVFHNPLVIAAVVDHELRKCFDPLKKLKNLSALHVCVFPHTIN